MPSLDGFSYWRSLDELADTPEFRAIVEKEFPTVSQEVISTASRRNFLKLMGASFALAGLVGCRWPKERIVPFAHRPDGRVDGEPEQFATAMDLGGGALGLLVTSYDGRPTKVEGNPGHPESLGGTHTWAQASVLELYDPDRSRSVVQRSGNQEVEKSFDDFVAWAGPLFASLRASGGTGLRILSGACSSPSLAALRQKLAAVMPHAGWTEWEPVSRDNERLGLALAFGKPVRAHYRLAEADVIVSLDSDFLCAAPSGVRLAREFASRRSAESGEMNRLWVVESALTVTGANADERHAVSARSIPLVALRLAAELAGKGVNVGALGSAPSGTGDLAFVPALAADLAAHRGKAVVFAGPSQPPEVHAVAALLNVALAGALVSYTEEPDGARPGHFDGLAALANELRGGSVDTLLVLGANPVYDAPVDLDFAGAMARAKNTIHLGVYRNETGRAAAWHVPEAHALESWSDARAWDGTVSIVQPLIEPLFDGKTRAELVALVLGEAKHAAYDIVNGHFAATWGGVDATRAWRTALKDGLVPNTALAAVAVEPNANAVAARAGALTFPAGGDVELVFIADRSVFDGRYANNAWLQEMPDPISKLTWDNALLVGPATAEKLGVVQEDLVRLKAGAHEIDVAVSVVPGIAAGTVALALGYGRTAAGSVGNGTGFNAYALRTSQAPWAVGASVQKTGRRYGLASTQSHWAIDTIGKKETERRAGELIRTASLEEYRKEPHFAQEGQEEFHSLWKEHEYQGHAWAMAIDLAKCIGCSACTVACQAENNIPVVGKDQVQRSRHMNWLRIDRYFRGKPENPEVAFQPMACVHCENAPCEQVCPVGATVHSGEGLNQMVYNRCIGTRYCSNNCPYKVRRFNFYNFNKDLTDLQMMQKNPDVTVRSRGVMEKCTYCTQRIERVKIQAKNDKRIIADGEIVPACAQACPTRAIVFGDLNDKGSAVRKAHEHQRSYAILAEINTKPRTHYLARLVNPAAGSGRSNGEHA